MNTPTNHRSDDQTPHAQHRSATPIRPVHVALAVAGALLFSSCGLVPGDDGQDISAEVEVAGVAAGAEGGGATTKKEPVDDETAGNIAAAVPGDVAPADVTEESVVPDAASEGLTGADIDTRFSGRSAVYLGAEFEIGNLISTDQTVSEYLESAPPSGDERSLIVEIAVTNTGNGGLSIPVDVLGIRLANGDRIAADDLFSADGDLEFSLRPPAQATERALLVFPDVDLDGASFEISEGGRIPELIPFSTGGPLATEPFAVALPATSMVAGLVSPSSGWSCGYVWDGAVRDARVLLEGVDGSQLERASFGERWLAIDLAVTNVTPDDGELYPCNEVSMPVTDVNPRLIVDGAAIAPTNRGSIGTAIERDATESQTFWFRIPADLAEVELTDVGGTPIAWWDLELPAVAGER